MLYRRSCSLMYLEIMLLHYLCVCVFVGFLVFFFFLFFFSSRRRHTRCALVTGVQTCALPISSKGYAGTLALFPHDKPEVSAVSEAIPDTLQLHKIGRASCRERVCQYV